MQQDIFRPMPWGRVTIEPGVLRRRADLNRAYMLSLKTENLLQNHYMEAGLWGPRLQPEGCHWGWESPTCQLRGHFLGHWLSAAAKRFAATGDVEIKGKADHIVAELARCQAENGGEWVGSIPETYLDWVARGKRVWAPHYTLHKTLMGLWEMYSLTGNEQALTVIKNWARWFHRWTGQFSRAQLDDILDVETGGMLEIWANLYGVTGSPEHRDLIERYDRPRLFDRLLAGEDPLTNKHANTTIPEVQGAAHAWEATGEERWRKIVDAYWRSAVEDRGYYCTGGQTNGEIWSAPQELSARLGEKTQEHCTVYNMMRLADWLLRKTGDIAYADYWERNLYNGILAQQHPDTGMIAYFLPLQAGSAKKWGTPTDDFWCCHGTLLEAHTVNERSLYFEDDAGLIVSQYVPSTLQWERGGVAIRVTQMADSQLGSPRRPNSTAFNLAIACDRPSEFTLKIRLPWWLAGAAEIRVDGERLHGPFLPSSLYEIRRTWGENQVAVSLPKKLAGVPLPDQPNMVAFMDGPVVLAGLSDEERPLYGDRDDPEALLIPHNEREWGEWEPGYRTQHQPRNLRFLPLHDIRDERFAVYFPVEEGR
ncbi:MAG: beta-L-arabinofuranosidase domain-containing protein [Chloroflexota bacterium]